MYKFCMNVKYTMWMRVYVYIVVGNKLDRPFDPVRELLKKRNWLQILTGCEFTWRSLLFNTHAGFTHPYVLTHSKNSRSPIFLPLAVLLLRFFLLSYFL